MVGLVDHYGAADCSTIEPGRDAIIAIMAGGPSEKLFRRGPCSGRSSAGRRGEATSGPSLAVLRHRSPALSRGGLGRALRGLPSCFLRIVTSGFVAKRSE